MIIYVSLELLTYHHAQWLTWRYSKCALENGIASTSTPYWDTEDDDDCGTLLFFCALENGIASTSTPYWDTEDDDDCGLCQFHPLLDS
nr:hypothetical protein [Tanacetum cinerariifolium]